ncbi:MAG: hypothetical protein H0V17_30220 [Deltaproteobacteria bacterium]|nr:hypothetical protein [Deltaproteobacteria bacterium]
MIKIWNAFSSNNSSSYRMIARFADAAVASDAAAALTAYLEAHAAEHVDDLHGEASPLQVLAKHYGFDWEDEGWGSAGDGPHVILEGEILFVYHRYCTGLGPGIAAFLNERGATSGDDTWADVQISVVFRAAHGVDPVLDNELEALFAQPRESAIYKSPPFRVPWCEIETRGKAAFYRDAGTVGLYFPVNPPGIALVKQWLAGHGIEGASIQFDELADEQLFNALTAARCTACTGPLEYLDPRLHDIESPQLVCKPCGGLYELAAFVG